MTISANYPTIRPTLLLDFANTEQLDPRITFSRPTTGTYYDGKTVALAEQNLVLQSQNFGTTWTASRLSVTVNSVTAPNGTTTASTLTEDSSASTNHRVFQSITYTTGTPYTFSVYAKANTRSQIFIRTGAMTDDTAGVLFDLSAVTATNVGTGATSSSITAVGSGWYRCVLTYSPTVAGSLFYIGLASGANPIYTGDGTSNLYVWGAQLEQRSSVTAYTATTTAPITNYVPVLLSAPANVARFEHNPVTGESLGLEIEEQRTNLAVRSSELTNASWSKSNSTIDGNVTIAPDGTQTVQLFNATTSAASCFQQISLGAGDYSMSVYVKRGNVSTVALGIVNVLDAITYNFDTGAVGGLSAGQTRVTSVGNGWVRIEFWRNCSAGTFGPSIKIGTAGGTVFVWGVQFELGQFATSYIPTTVSQVTRSADSASMTGTNFSSWYRADEGTVYSEASCYAPTVGARGIASFDNGAGSSANEIDIRFQSQTAFLINYAGAGQATLFSGLSTSANVFSKAVGTYKTNDVAFSGNANTVQTDTSATIPNVLARLTIGNLFNDTTNYSLNGTIKKFAYYPKRLTNAELQGLTTV